MLSGFRMRKKCESSLEGSVRKSGGKVRITAQLINASDGSHLWAQNYDRALKDIFKIQDEVSQIIAESLQVAVGNQIIDTAQKTQPNNIEAYDYYLKAKHAYYYKFYVSMAEKDWAEALHYAEKSIEIDPQYALGHAIISRLYVEKFFSLTNNQNDLLEAEHYANLAYKLGPNIPESLRAMQNSLLMKHDFDQSFYFSKKLIEVNPNDFENYYLLEWFYVIVGMPHDQIKYATRAIELNPLYYDVYSDRAFGDLSIGDKENFIRDVRLCLSIQPDAMKGKVFFAYYFLWINDLQNADKYLTELEQRISAEKTPQERWTYWNDAAKTLRAIYRARLGKEDQALSIAKSLPIYFTIWIYAELGMAHEAVQMLQKSLKTSTYDSYPNYEFLSQSSFYENIRNHPEFQQLLRQQKIIYDEMIRKYRIQ